MALPPRDYRWTVTDVRSKLEWELTIDGEALTLTREATTIVAQRSEAIGGKAVVVDHAIVAPVLRIKQEGVKMSLRIDDDAAVQVVRWLEVGHVVGRRTNAVLIFLAILSLLLAMPMDADPEFGAEAVPFSPRFVVVAVTALGIVASHR